jgi:hypothetical protein
VKTAVISLIILSQAPNNLTATNAVLTPAPKNHDAHSLQNLSLDDIEAGLTPLKSTTPAQWRISWSGDAARSATISWSTAQKSSTNTLYYDTIDHKRRITDYKNRIQCQINGKYSTRLGFTKSAYYHHAALKNLKPDTAYYFIMSSDGITSRRLWFMTAPATGCSFSLLHGGDSRSRHLNRCRMNLLIANLVKQDPRIIALLHGGDYVMNGDSWNHWKNWLSHNELTTGGNGRVLPIIPVRGNHDEGPIFHEVFNLPDWYTTRLGHDIAIISFNSEEVLEKDKTKDFPNKNLQWLDNELAKLRPQTRWLLANYHLPLYPAVKSIPDQTAILAPIFEKYNIDLGCECDGHNIKRTVPIRNGRQDPTGITYIGEGGMGVTQRTPKKDRWYLAFAARGNHIMKLSFSESQLKIQTILQNTKLLNTFTLPPAPAISKIKKR